MSDILHRELLRHAVEAARENDRDTALKNIKEVLDDDPKNTTALYLLARLTSDTDDKFDLLDRILEIDPDHQKAQNLWDKLEAQESGNKKKSRSGDEEIIPGVTKRHLIRVIGIIVTLVVAIILMVVLNAMMQNANDRAEEDKLLNIANTETQVVVHATQAAYATEAIIAQAAATQAALISPTPMPTITPLYTIPPTWTATPFVDPNARETLEPPSGLTGQIGGWSGSDTLSQDALLMAIYDLGGDSYLEPSILHNEKLGREGSLFPNGTQFVFTEYTRTAGDLFEVILVDLQGEEIPSHLDQAESLGLFWDSYMPSISTDGTKVVYIGDATDNRTAEVYMTILTVEMANSTTRLTNDTAIYSYPAISPDGSKVLAVRENPMSADNPGPDIVIIDVASQTFVTLTVDNDAIYETMPRWSPDGSLVVYAAATSPDENHNLYVRSSDPAGAAGRMVIDDLGDALHPVYSPDGGHLAFSSDRNGWVDIYIFNLGSREMFQLTNSREEDYPGNWVSFDGS